MQNLEDDFNEGGELEDEELHDLRIVRANAPSSGTWVAACWARLVHTLEFCRDSLSTLAYGKTRAQLDAGDNPYELLAQHFNSPNFQPRQHAFVKQEGWEEAVSVHPTYTKKVTTAIEMKKKLLELKKYITLWSSNFERCVCLLTCCLPAAKPGCCAAPMQERELRSEQPGSVLPGRQQKPE